VTLSGLLGTREDLFTYDSPAMTHISPANEATSAALSLTISGINLGYGVDVTPSMQIGLTACGTTTWTTTTLVLCKSKMGTGLARSLIAAVAKNIGTAGSAFSYDAPAVSSKGTNSPASAGISITVTGLNFASSDLTVTTAVGYTPCATSTWNSATSLACFLADGFGSSVPILATINGLVGTQPGVFSFDSPVVSFVGAKNGASSGGTIVTFSGKNFGFSDSTPTGVIGVSSCATSLWTTDTSVRCGIAYGSSTSLRTILTIDSVPGTMTHVFTYDSPTLTHTAAFNGPNTGAVSVSVFGLNFAGMDTSVSVIMDATTPCLSSQWNSFTSLVCGLPSGYGTVQLSATVSAQVGTLAMAFTFDAPVMSHFNQRNIAVTTDGSVTLNGYNFAMVDRTNAMYIGATLCGTTSWSTNTAVLCHVQSRGIGHPGSPHHVRVMDADLTSTIAGAFTYDAPTITQTAYLSAPNAGGISVTMNGFDFGLLDFTATAQLGFTLCGTASWTSGTTVSCISPQGAGAPLPMTMTLASLVGTQKHAYSYAAPEITDVAGINGAASGAALVTMNGQNFGLTNTTPTTRIGSTICTTSQWSTSTSIVCIAAYGTGASLTAAVTVAKQVGTRVKSFSYDSPVITASDRPNGAVSGSTSVTVMGSNFGMENFSPTITIGRSACQTTMWATDTSLVCGLMPGSGPSQTVTAMVTSVYGTTVSQYSFDAPVITTSFMVNGPFAGGVVVTIHGTNFGARDLSSTAQVGQTYCASTVYVTNTAVSCTGPAGYGKALPVRAIYGNVVGTALAAFTYNSPVPTAVLQSNMAQSGGETVTIWGTNFGPSDTTPNFAVGGTTCAKTQWVTETSVSCYVGGGVGVGLAVTANIQAMIGTLPMIFSWDAPVLTLLNDRNGPTTAGSAVTLVGKNFGMYSGHQPVAAIKDSVCSENTWISYTSVLCAGSASGTGVAHSVALTVGDAVGTFFLGFTYDAPVALTLREPNAPVTAGGIMTLVGANFGDTSSSPLITLGATSCACSVWTTFSTLECQVPPGSGMDGISVTTVVDSVIGTQPSMFTYDAPILTDLYGNSPLTGSGAVTIFGMNFGETDPNPTILLNNAECLNSVWQTTSSILCTAPVGSGMNLAIAGSVLGLYSTALNAMTYDPPVVTAIVDPYVNGPTTGGAMFTLQGFNFGVTSAVDNTNDRWIMADPATGLLEGANSAYNPVTLTIASKWCNSVSWTSDTEVVCASTSQGGGALQDVGVTADGNSGALSRQWTYDAPVLTGILQPNGPAAGGAALSIIGMNFGWKYTDAKTKMMYMSSATPAAIVSTSDNLKCETTLWLSDSSVSCITPPGTGSVKSVSVDTGCNYAPCLDSSRAAPNAGTMEAAFTYDSPVVTFLVQNNGPTVGGAQLTFHGLNFGPNDALWNARIGQTLCVSNSWLSNTAATCTTPAGKASTSTSGRTTVAITIGTAAGQVGTLMDSFRYNSQMTMAGEMALPESLKDQIAAEAAATPVRRRNANGNLVVPRRRRAIVLPDTVTKYYYQVGDMVNVTFSAYAEDEGTNVAIATWSGRTAASFAGYEYRMTSRPRGRRAYGYFTWSPASTGDFNLCAQLIDSKQIVQDYLCVKIIVLSCQHVVQPGQTLDSIAEMYKVSPRTIWWLNADLRTRGDVKSSGSAATTLKAGRLVNIGRTYTIRSGEALTTIVKDLNSSWYWINKHNPKKIFFPATVSLDSMSYKTRQDFVGREYCVVADISPVLHRESVALG